MPASFAPSDDARAFMSDPANCSRLGFNASELAAKPAENWAGAEKTKADTRSARHCVALDWQRIVGVQSLLVKPRSRDRKAQIFCLYGEGFVIGRSPRDLMVNAALAAGSGMQMDSPTDA